MFQRTITVILENLKGLNDKFINLNENSEELESANETYFKQNPTVLNHNEIIENYISQKSPFRESLLSKSVRSCKCRVYFSSSQSKTIPPVLHLFHVKELITTLNYYSHNLMNVSKERPNY